MTNQARLEITDWRTVCSELIGALDSGVPAGRIRLSPLARRARAALAESATSDYKVASEDTMRRIRSTTKRWRVSVIISTDDSSIDTRIGCGIWKCLDIEREILESVSLPEYLPAIKETTND